MNDQTSQHADLLNTLCEMAMSPTYAAHQNELREADRIILRQEKLINELSSALRSLRTILEGTPASLTGEVRRELNRADKALTESAIG